MCIYTNNEGRKFVIYKENGKSRTKTYARYLMEQHLGRELLPNEDVHHIDGDRTNDVIENLIVLDHVEHVKLHNLPKYQDTEEICFICGNKFIMTAEQHSQRERNFNRSSRIYTKSNLKNVYFCCKSCSSKYGRAIQLNQNFAIYYQK